jgi:membrane protease YdiL (CAAX protease family)
MCHLKELQIYSLISNSMEYQQRFNPLSQLVLLLAFCGAGIIVSSIITGIIGNMVLHVQLKDLAEVLLKPENVQVSRLLQVLTTFFIMALPALIVTEISGGNAVERIGFNEVMSGSQAFIVVLMVIMGFFISGALSELNQMIPITKNATSYFQKLENEYNKQVMVLGNMKSLADFILSMFVLALVPAVFEEMLFRGSLQQIMIALTRNAFAGILITGIFFSAVHLSYYGFLPRLFLGMMLGYIFYFSKNLWLSIIAHFLNNAYSLLGMFALSRSGKLSMEALDETYPLYYGVVGIGVIILLFVAFNKESKKLLRRKSSIVSNNSEV